MHNKELAQEELLQLFRMDQEVIDVEEQNGQIFPVVRTYDDEEYHLRFWCIHCRTWHLHGRGGPQAKYQEGRGGNAGHRSAHCTTGNSPFKANGVVLHVVGKFSETIRKQYRKGTSLFCPVCRNRYSAALNACNCGGCFINKKRRSSHPELAEKYQSFL
ncbi:hypothetical protein [Geomonas ferrireducens]|uniref:hypothetical protein n=1 Tax=Geomonas ferrireducens TaxID=2570227 RepID=UPI0010A8C4B4|nr:hypothetical protein [Geomonas ferrireducens]